MKWTARSFCRKAFTCTSQVAQSNKSPRKYVSKGFESSRPQRIGPIFPTAFRPSSFSHNAGKDLAVARLRSSAMLTGLQAPAAPGDLVHVTSQRVAQPCHAHLSCSHVHRRAVSSAARHSTSRRDASESTARPPCLSHSTRKHENKLNLSTCAVADEVRQTATESSAQPAADASASVGAQELKPEAAAAISAAAGTPDVNAEKASAPHAEAPSEGQGSEATPLQQASASSQLPAQAASAGSTPPSTAPPRPSARPAGEQKVFYRGFKNMRHNSFQKGPDSNARLDMGSRPSRGPIPIPPEEADWLLPERTVLAKVVYSNPNGFKVEMVNDTRVGG